MKKKLNEKLFFSIQIAILEVFYFDLDFWRKRAGCFQIKLKTLRPLSLYTLSSSGYLR